MKTILLKELHLINFKGLRKFDCTFNVDLTTISGRNALGKTTIFDSFIYALFGKNSEDSKSFSIKTLDKDGKVIPKLPHEVTVVLDVDGQEITLTRKYEEKWTKHRGSAEEVFEGNKESFLWNDVPMSRKEYDAHVSEICDELVFKLITSPTYFTSLPWKEQRTILFDMAGGITNEELAEKNEDFKILLANITGKTIDEYKKEVGAKKKRIKSEIESIPARIEELNYNNSNSYNWETLEAQVKNNEERIAEIDDILTDISKSMSAKSEDRKYILDQIAEVQRSINDRKNDIRRSCRQHFFDMQDKRNKLIREVKEWEHKINSCQNIIDEELQNKARYEQLRDKLRNDFLNTQASSLEIKEDDYECPCCHRPYNQDKIEEIRAQMQNVFNAKKANDLKRINETARTNKENIELVTQSIENKKAKIEEYKKKINELRQQEASLPQDTTDVMDSRAGENAIADDVELNILLEKEKELQEQIKVPIQMDDDTQRDKLRDEKNKRQEENKILNQQLGTKAIIEQNKVRIEELEQELKTQSQALADLEKIEFTIQEFSMARINAITDRINSMFVLTKFSLFKEQLNGGIAECCEATYGGIPLTDVNNAHKILVGLDIINTICHKKDICAPVFIDNAEGINDIPRLTYQRIALKVTEDNQLTIK